MYPSRSIFAAALTIVLLLLALNVEARCHNLSSTAFAHCPIHGDEANAVVKAAATVPYPVDALPTGQTRYQEKVAAVKAQDSLPIDTSADSTPWKYGDAANQTLPSPSATLMTVALGSGTQNYSCPSVPSATPSLVGATANLFHLTDPSTPVTSVIIAGLPEIGKHFFNGAGTPSFQFFDSGALGLLQAAKKGSIPAPGGAGVPWLQLVTTGTGGYGNLQEVYRVKTHGGTPHPGVCNGKAPGDNFEVPYRAQYWFYGSGAIDST